ncbi:hypothetical protein LMG24238_07629 [Paraburkholderia sediminicola]|uniref:Uncharacterized protein n=1 Tax=Paraburkholderia sediminicola TaxID=458836 RepID=A0A6J5CX66_9BURK|nr:hypothetical protein [Paraburkholderia sediminicola]CAB3745497.1 hypothetical protein LMG24238_07629 [Paraburkholderia sediminicola]
MRQSKENREIGFIRAKALDDLAATSDEEIRNEYREAGQDIAAVARQTRDTLRDVVAAGMRAKLASAKAATKASAATPPINRARPAMERLKEIVAETFMREPRVAMAFRDGKKQTDEDLATVYDDLVRMGIIKPEDHGD